MAVRQRGGLVVAQSADRRQSSGEALNKLQALILLGGSLRPTPLAAAIGRPVLDLPVEHGRSVLDQWQEQTVDMVRATSLQSLPVRLMLDRHAPEPTVPRAAKGVHIRAERDPHEYRGTGGILRDLSSDYADDDFILVANAGQILLHPLANLVLAMSRTDGDLCVVSHLDGTPISLMLLRCATLRLISPVGYVDLKEQALPVIAKRFRVRVVRLERPSGVPIWTPEEYIRVLSLYHRLKAGNPAINNPFAEKWQAAFSIVEDGANVESGCRLHDSVVLRGGSVEKDSILVRSVVCAGGIVRQRRKVVKHLVASII